MIEGIIKGLLGPSLVPLFDYVTSHPEIIAIIFFIIVGLYVAGRIQLNNISKNTQAYVLEKYKEEIQRRPNITARGLYKLIYPDWSIQIKKWALFIPHRLDLWPTRVTPENVKSKISFTEKWVADVLGKNKIKIENSSTEE